MRGDSCDIMDFILLIVHSSNLQFRGFENRKVVEKNYAVSQAHDMTTTFAKVWYIQKWQKKLKIKTGSHFMWALDLKLLKVKINLCAISNQCHSLFICVSIEQLAGVLIWLCNW